MLMYIRNYVYTSKIALSIKKMKQCEKILVAGMGKCEFFLRKVQIRLSARSILDV